MPRSVNSTISKALEWNVSESPLLAALLIYLKGFGMTTEEQVLKAKEILKLYLDPTDKRLTLLDSV